MFCFTAFRAPFFVLAALFLAAQQILPTVNAGTCSLTSRTSTSISLSWSPYKPRGAYSYRVRCTGQPACSTTAASPRTSATAGNLAAGTTYNFIVDTKKPGSNSWTPLHTCSYATTAVVVPAYKYKCCIVVTTSSDINVHPTVSITKAATGVVTYSHTSSNEFLNFMLDLPTCTLVDTSSTGVNNPDEGPNTDVNSWVTFQGPLIVTLQSGNGNDQWIGVLYFSAAPDRTLVAYDPPNNIYRKLSRVSFCAAGNSGTVKPVLSDIVKTP